MGGPRTTPAVRTLTRRETATAREVDRLRASGIWTGHAWAVCSECGEGRLVPRSGDAGRKLCILTPGCKGRTRPEDTPTPQQAAQRVMTGLFAAARAVMGARRQLKVPKPRLPKETPGEAPLL